MVLLSYILVTGVEVNCITSADMRVTSMSVFSTFDLAVLYRVAIGLMYLIHPMDISLCVLNLSHLIQA